MKMKGVAMLSRQNRLIALTTLFTAFSLLLCVPIHATNDEYFDKQYALSKIHAPEAWKITPGSEDIIIAIIDSGVDYDHPDLKDKIWTNKGEIPNNGKDDDGNGYIDDYYGFNFVGATRSPNGVFNNKADTKDDRGHGTHVAGIAAAVYNNQIGIAGVAPKCKIMPIKVLDATGTKTSGLSIAIIYAVNNGAHVINISLGPDEEQAPSPEEIANRQAVHNAIQYAYKNYRIVIVSSGNDDGPVSWLASFDEVLAVGATDKNDNRWSQLDWLDFFRNRIGLGGSNFGPELDVVAPGYKILSTLPSYEVTYNKGILGGSDIFKRKKYYDELTGTSQAAPHVSGLAALILSKNPLLNNQQVYQIIRETAWHPQGLERDDYYGFGIIDAHKALLQLNGNQDTANIILTIDRSGSMKNPVSETNNTQRIVVARQAAEEFTHFVVPSDYVGVVDYAGDVNVTQPLSSVSVDVLRGKINQVQVGGSGTNIGAPLGTAYQELESSSSKNANTVIILLTDGAHNTGTAPLTVVKNSPNFVNKTWPIYTIGLGSGDEFNEPLLQEIAKETGGQYKHASSAQELGDFYATLAARIRGGTTLVRLRDFINQGQTINHAVEFDPLIETSHLILNWGGSKLELTLTTPQGETITPNAAGIEYSSGENYLIYKINQPEAGKWFAKIHGADVPTGGEQYILSVTGTSGIISSLLPFKPHYNPGDKISIGVELLARGSKRKPADITDITAEAHILRPDGLAETVSLSNHALERSEGIGEGVYAGDYTNTALLGSYLITVQLHGTTSSGAPFNRNITEAVIVGDIYQIVISQTSLRPEPESVVTDATPTIQARISGPSRNIDVGSIKLTLDNTAVPHTYDPVNQLVSYKPQTELASEKHLVALGLKDAHGNAIPQARWEFIVDTEADYWFLNGETQRLMRLSVKDDAVRVVESIKGVDPNGIYVIDRSDGTCWFASPYLGKVNRYGEESPFIFSELEAPMALAVDETQRALWVADGALNQVVKSDLDGNIQEKVQLSSPPKAIAARADGGLWVATRRGLQIITADGKLTEPIKQKVKYLQSVPQTDEIWAGDSITGHVFHISGDGTIIAEGGIKKLSGIVATKDGGCWLLGRKTAFALNPDGSLRGTVSGLSHPRTILFQPSDGSVWVLEGDNQLLRLYRPVSGEGTFLRITGLLRGNLAIEPAIDIKWTPAQPDTTPTKPEQTPSKIKPAPKPKPDSKQQPEKQTSTTPTKIEKQDTTVVPAPVTNTQNSGEFSYPSPTVAPETKSENPPYPPFPKGGKGGFRREENEGHYQGHWNLIPRDTIILMTADMTVVRNDNELIQATPVKDIIPLLNQINISTADVTTLTLFGTSAQEGKNIDVAVLVTGQYQVKLVFEHLRQVGWQEELYGQDELYLNPQAEAEGVAGISNDTIALGSVTAL
ncbi:TPA: VWA domain-containing protein, partial [Candidatus Poribacteria bacterium]|nr:VWA domain-containing protein [Candidatus Poribacteria bacterium]